MRKILCAICFDEMDTETNHFASFHNRVVGGTNFASEGTVCEGCWNRRLRKASEADERRHRKIEERVEALERAAETKRGGRRR